jgi:metal-sulfur cluster biosynthetic enzyme
MACAKRARRRISLTFFRDTRSQCRWTSNNGMSNVLKGEVQTKLARLPGVKEVHVEVVFDPPWHPGLMSDAAKLQLGFDLDYGTTQSSPPIYGERK